MTRVTRPVARGAVLLLVALVLGACGGGEDGDSGYLDMLRFIPDTEETRELVVMGDIARAYTLVGVDAPPRGLSWEEEAEFFQSFIIEAVDQDLPIPQYFYFGMVRTD